MTTQSTTSQKDLFILDGFENFGFNLKFVAENENGKTFNVHIHEDDFSSYFGAEVSLLNFDFKNNDEDFNEAAQHILDQFQKGHTDYEVEIHPQKLLAYEFENKDGQTFKRCKSWVKDPVSFTRENNFVSFAPIYG